MKYFFMDIFFSDIMNEFHEITMLLRKYDYDYIYEYDYDYVFTTFMVTITVM